MVLQTTAPGYVKIVFMFFFNLKHELDITDRRGAENWDTVDEITIDRLDGPLLHTLPEKFENGVFNLKTNQSFSSTLPRKKT